MSRGIACVLAGAAVIASLGVGVPAADEPRAVFGVGVLRRDGIIVPFAAFNGKKWIDNWPVPALDLDVPISVRDVPSSWWGPTKPLDRWQAWIGSEPQSLRVVQPDWVEASCMRQVGLRTDYKPAQPPPPPDEQPYPKDGLAVSPPQPVERIAIVPPEADDVRELAPSILETFNQEERKTEDRYGHPVSRRAREGRAPEVEAVYAFGDHPRIYYVEAARHYRQLGQAPDQCAAMAFGRIWFAREGKQVRALGATVALLSCDRRDASYMLPLGAMRLAGKQYWLAQYAGFDHERYAVIEIKPKTVEGILSVWAGTCDR